MSSAHKTFPFCPYPSLYIIQEGETLHKLQGSGWHQLQPELSILQLSNETVHFLTSLHWQDVVDHLQGTDNKQLKDESQKTLIKSMA